MSKNLLANSRKIRFSYSDPDATESSMDECNQMERMSKRTVHEFIVPLGKLCHRNTESEYVWKNSSEKCGRDEFLNLTAKKSFIGTRRRKSGKYSSEVWDPRQKKSVWLGTFSNAKEASAAYLSKKRQIQEELSAKRGFAWIDCEKTRDHPSSVPKILAAKSSCEGGGDDDSVVKEGYSRDNNMSNERRRSLEGVRMRKSGRFYTEIRDHQEKKRVRACAFSSAKEASVVFLSMEHEIKELRAKRGKGAARIDCGESPSLNFNIPSLDSSDKAAATL